MRLQAYTRLGRWRFFGAPVYVHWTVLVGAAALFFSSRGAPETAAVAIACYLATILIHEAGHAWFARRLGLKPISIHFSIIHGLCRFGTHGDEGFYEEKELLIVAWGGVAAQAVVAVPLLALDALTGLRNVYLMAPVVGVLGYLSLGIALFNLIPAPGFDGAKAWRLIPVLWRELRERRAFKRHRKYFR